MGLIDFASLQLASFITLNILIGVVVLSVGNRLSRNGDWLSVTAVFGLLVVFSLAWSEYVHIGMSPVTFLKTWWVGGESSDVFLIGFLNDPYSLTVSFLFCFLSLMIFLARDAIEKRQFVERIYAAIPIALGGLTLCWLSATPWLSFLGLFIAVLGGFISSDTSWDRTVTEANWANRFIRDHCIGILISFTGACVLLSVGVGLRWDQVALDYFNPHVQLGFGLFLLGLLIHFRPFPFFGWINELPPGQFLIRLFLMQLVPVWASFAFIFRSYPLLKATGVLEIFGWICIALSFLGYLIGLFQDNSKKILFSLCSSGSLLAVSMLCFASDRASFLFMVGLTLAALLIGMVISLVDLAPEKPKGQNQSIVLKIFVFFGGVIGSGLAGFVSSGASLKWIHLSQFNVLLLTFASLLLFLHVFNFWNLVWRVVSKDLNREISPWSLTAGVMIILFSTGLIWTGTVTGGLFFEDQDQLVFSFSDLLFGSHQTLGSVLRDQQKFLTASSFYWAVVLLALGAAYGAKGQWNSFYKKVPKVTELVGQSFKMDKTVRAMFRAVVAFSYRIEVFISETIFHYFIPKLMSSAFLRISKRLRKFDEKIVNSMNHSANRSIGLPAKMIQLIQNGDIQWYILIAFGTAVAIMLHFIQFE